MRREKLEITTLLEYNIFIRWENSSVREWSGRRKEKTGKRTVLGEGGAVCLLFTGHPRHWAPTDSYDSRPAQTRRLFCGSLVAFVPRRVVPVQLPRRPFPPHVGRDGSSAFFFHRFFHSLFTASLLFPLSQSADLISTSPWSLAPVSIVCACSSFFLDSLFLPLDSLLSISFCLLPLLPCLSLLFHASRVLIYFAR